MKDDIKERLQDLVTLHGPEKVLHYAYQLLGGPGTAPQPAKVEHVLIVDEAADEACKAIGALGSILRAATDGASDVVTQLEKLQRAKAKGVPAEYLRVLSPESLDYTLSALDSAVTSQMEAGNARESANRDRSELVKRRIQLETSIKLTEAEAFMNVHGEGKEQFAMVGEKKVMLNNDTNRDAYRRTMSKADREELARVNAEIGAIEADIARARDKWDTAKEASDTLRARANLQAALLNFLASRG